MSPEITIEPGRHQPPSPPRSNDGQFTCKILEENRTPNQISQTICAPCIPTFAILQKVVGEVIATFTVIFLGCGSAMVDVKSQGSITHVGVSAVWGLVVTAMIYSVGHISGAHMNPAVTLAFASVGHFPWIQVPGYIGAQTFAAISASYVLRLMFGSVAFVGATFPAGTDVQSLLLEIIITFVLMFVVSAVSTDTRAKGDMAGIAVGSTIAMNVAVAGPISGASMNPARTLGSAIAGNKYRGIWVYIAGPLIGSLLGAWSYTALQFPTNKAVPEGRKSELLFKT